MAARKKAAAEKAPTKKAASKRKPRKPPVAVEEATEAETEGTDAAEEAEAEAAAQEPETPPELPPPESIERCQHLLREMFTDVHEDLKEEAEAALALCTTVDLQAGIIESLRAQLDDLRRQSSKELADPMVLVAQSEDDSREETEEWKQLGAHLSVGTLLKSATA